MTQPNSKPRIYLSPPHVSDVDRQLLLDAFDSNWIAPLGPHVNALEREFADVCGTADSAALSSGTAALHLSLLLSGVQAGDEVWTSTLTFVATANAIRYVGAKPVFVDSDLKTWNMDPNLLDDALRSAAAVGRLPKAVVVVDLYGQCADYDSIAASCDRYAIPIIEDAAEALGAKYRNKPAGSFGSIGCFSFNGNKIITASGGGMLVSDYESICERARWLGSQARDPEPHYEHSTVGFNYRMSNLLAAIARGQLSQLPSRVAKRRSNYQTYKNLLADLPGVSFMPEPDGFYSNNWLTCITLDSAAFGATREDVRLLLEQHNIESRPVWKPMHMQPIHVDAQCIGGSVSENLFRDGLCLPSGSTLTDDQLHEICHLVKSCCSFGRRKAA